MSASEFSVCCGSVRARAGERGQAAVEFVALLPVLALTALALGQAAIAGWAAWSASGAARVAARAHALGDDPARAARRVLPAMLGSRARVRVVERRPGRADAVSTGRETVDQTTVRLRIPTVVPGLRLGTVVGSARLPSQVGE